MAPLKMEDLSEDRILHLVDQIKDWQSIVRSQTENTVSSYPVGVACFPTAVPRSRFDQAIKLQTVFNRLYCAVAEDDQWLYNVIRDIIPTDSLAKALWSVHEAVKKDGYVQSISLGLFRSDYMLHLDHDKEMESDDEDELSDASLKQVEMNTFSASGGSHADKVQVMHHYLARTGMYETSGVAFDSTSLATNRNIKSIGSSLALAHETYGHARSKGVKATAVLMIVQPNNFNIADERPIEYELWDRQVPVPTYRLEFGADVLQYTSLGQDRELLFQPPWLESGLEISVVYMRAGYEAHEYDDVGIKARIQLEQSTAIKCPSVLSHITTFKKVQQALSAPGTLEAFLPGHEGLHARKLACDLVQSMNYILKPSLEGGGHNVYGSDIPPYLSLTPEAQWSSYILMERIHPPLQSNLLMGPAVLDSGETVSELGIFGCCLWQSAKTADAQASEESDHRIQMLSNEVGGWTFKTKFADIDEMSVVKGFGHFDTPLLVDL
ncbi:Glutathione synthetase [Penicillium ucsense]|uniref:Glutathione synthetase n=1 Tax=Penicillium ucsense TaxID=2839758 RepID=A0A8J8W8M4_9EURO|nr:Glutathione synthetase [Penicillium ucsense]KAF7735096.1 Glutathione synthetase [Penicillium ucsense]